MTRGDPMLPLRRSGKNTEKFAAELRGQGFGGWDPRDANSVGDLAERILGGARIRCNDMDELGWARRVVV